MHIYSLLTFLAMHTHAIQLQKGAFDKTPDRCTNYRWYKECMEHAHEGCLHHMVFGRNECYLWEGFD